MQGVQSEVADGPVWGRRGLSLRLQGVKSEVAEGCLRLQGVESLGTGIESGGAGVESGVA